VATASSRADDTAAFVGLTVAPEHRPAHVSFSRQATATTQAWGRTGFVLEQCALDSCLSRQDLARIAQAVRCVLWSQWKVKTPPAGEEGEDQTREFAMGAHHYVGGLSSARVARVGGMVLDAGQHRPIGLGVGVPHCAHVGVRIRQQAHERLGDSGDRVVGVGQQDALSGQRGVGVEGFDSSVIPKENVAIPYIAQCWAIQHLQVKRN